MRNGHYTKGYIKELKVYPASGEKCQSASCRIRDTAFVLFSNGAVVQVRNEETHDHRELNIFLNAKTEPLWYVVAAYLRGKALGHGGHRLLAGRKPSPASHPERRPRTIRMSEYEYQQVKNLLSKLRKD